MTDTTYLDDDDTGGGTHEAHPAHLAEDGEDGAAHFPALHAFDSAHHDHVRHDAPNVVGTPLEDAPHWIHQTTPFSCAVVAQRGIIEAITGEPVSEAQLCTEAAERGWLTSEDGTSLEDTGKLLELHGVHTHHEMHASVGDIYSELASGHKVIVGVQAEKLWDAGDPFAAWTMPHGANHAIWVTGIDRTDPHDVKVIINDSGDPDGAGKTYSLHDFTSAWSESGYAYIATDKEAPGLSNDAPDFDAHAHVFPDMVHWAHEHLAGAGTLLAATAFAAAFAGSSKIRGPSPAAPAPAPAAGAKPRDAAQPQQPHQPQQAAPGAEAAPPGGPAAPADRQPAPATAQSLAAMLEARVAQSRQQRLAARRTRHAPPPPVLGPAESGEDVAGTGNVDSPAGENVIRFKSSR